MARLLLELFANQRSFFTNEILIAYSGVGSQSLAQFNRFSRRIIGQSPTAFLHHPKP
jgi:hypothetical protein